MDGGGLLGTFLVLCFALCASALDDLVILKAERKIDLQSHVVRNIFSFKVENVGSSPEPRFLLGLLPKDQETLAFASIVQVAGKGKSKSYVELPLAPLDPADPSAPSTNASSGLVFLAAQLPKPLEAGTSVTIEGFFSFMWRLEPFPAEIAQSETQLLLYTDSSLVLSPYPVKSQSTLVKLPSNRVESFEAAEPSRRADSELKLGPYEDVGPQTEAPLVVHFENNLPIPVAVSVNRELEVSHWGNVYVTEDYDIVHQGAKHKGVFSRLELQMRPHSSGVSSLKGLVAHLPRGARSVYFRDEIGNISTSNFRTEKRKSVLELSPRYPLFGGWRTTFTVGYSVPLQDLVFVLSDGTRMLNSTFGTAFQELPIEKLTVKVVLPEGSRGVAAQTPFSLSEESTTTKYSYLDIVGRPVVVLVKERVVQELSMQYFQVTYNFSPLSLFAEPLMLIAAFALFFLACAIYVRLDLTIAKKSPAYQASLMTDMLMDALQRLQHAVQQRLKCVDAIEASLVQLGRTGNAALARSVRKTQEEKLKELQGKVKDAIASIEGTHRAPKFRALAQQLEAKDLEYVEKALKKHALSVEAYEKSLPEKEIEKAVAPLAEALSTLKAEIKNLLLLLDN